MLDIAVSSESLWECLLSDKVWCSLGRSDFYGPCSCDRSAAAELL